jgi:nitrite reductase/ring-hydroxylating ferredoxin subunit
MQIFDDKVVIPSADLVNGAKGLRFPLPNLGQYVTGFAIRFNDKAYAYINQWAPVAVDVDWNDGDFFTAQQDFIICSTHGAHYRPDNGFCVMGPCKGKSLKPVALIEQNGEIIINIASLNR